MSLTTEGSHPAWQRIRAAFLAGVLVTVPIGVTISVLWFLVSWVDGLQPSLLFGRRIPGLGILLVTAGVVGVGFATQNWVGGRVVSFYEDLLHRVPVLNSLYRGVKQVVETALLEGSRSVKQVVVVEWPRKGVYSLAFHTGSGFLQREDGVRLLNVFLPSTPNPTTGFYFMVPEDEIIPTGLTFEDAAKLLMSAGLVGAPSPIMVPTHMGALPMTPPSLDDAAS